jgi:dipeptidyl aminopeptidase/acylaminoacyl peptidase
MFRKPTELTSTGAATEIHPMYTGRLLFSRSSLTSPNDVYLIQHLPRQLSDLTKPREGVAKSLKGDLYKLSGFTEASLRETWLHPGEEFYFAGANDKQIHGWALKPRGWKEGDKKKWPVVLLIHGGPQGAWEDQWSTRWNPNGAVSLSDCSKKS